MNELIKTRSSEDITNENLQLMRQLQDDVEEIKGKFNTVSRFVDYVISMDKNVNTMKNIIIFWFILTIINLIGSIYIAVKISSVFRGF